MKKIFLLITYGAIIGIGMVSCGNDDDGKPCMDKVWYRDKDGDGRGDRIYYLYSCKVQPKGFVDNADDKNDADPNG